MTAYRLLNSIDWNALNGTKVEVQVSGTYIVLVPLKAGQPPAIIAQVVKPRTNHQPVASEPSAVQSIVQAVRASRSEPMEDRSYEETP